METQQPPLHEKTNVNDHFNVDTSRPFRSVKEAVEVFGERFLATEIYSLKPFTFPKHETPGKLSSSPYLLNPKQDRDDELDVANMLKNLRVELEETKRELNLLKERESEMEIALASLNAELHKNMSKMAAAEAAAAAKAVATRGMVVAGRHREGSIDADSIVRMENSTSLAQLLNLAKEGYFSAKKQQQKKKMMRRKKKPVIPLLANMFSRKKGSSNTLHNPLYIPSHMCFS